jgi:hypothetical protein
MIAGGVVGTLDLDEVEDLRAGLADNCGWGA